jgi:hypothetical protein
MNNRRRQTTYQERYERETAAWLVGFALVAIGAFFVAFVTGV